MEEEMTDLLKCPHCHGMVPRGARVCRGCNAEIKYGTPPFIIFVLIGVAWYLGYETSEAVSASLSFLGWIVGIGIFVVGGGIAAKKFEKRAVFHRIYRT